MLIRGAQLQTGSLGVRVENLAPGALSASAYGRSVMENGYFSSASMVDDKFNAGIINLDRLVEAVLALTGGTMAGVINMAGNRIDNVGSATGSNEAANWGQVLQAATASQTGLDVKNSCRVASSGSNVDLVNMSVTDFDGAGQGVTLVAGDRILLKDQTAGAENGLYSVGTVTTGAADLTRTFDADEDNEVTSQLFTFIEEGDFANQGWVLTTNDPITVDVTSLTFTQFTGVGALTYGTPGTISPDDTAQEGSAATVARSDHQHAITTALANTIVPDATPSEGTSGSFARADHVHGIITETARDVSSSNAEGTSGSFARADHIHRSPKPVLSNKAMTSNATPNDGDQATAGTVAFTPALDSYIGVRVNGVHYTVGDGVKTTDCYFSNDGGTTARSIAAVQSGDTLHWNQSIANFKLKAGKDSIDYDYIAF